MTHDPHRPDLTEAERLVEESARRSAAELRAARIEAAEKLSLANRLRRLREENGFRDLFLHAMRGSSG